MLKNNRGDTIVEVLIALCVLGVAIIGASTSVNNSYARTINANYRQQALQLLNNQIELIKGGNNETNNGGMTLSTLNLTVLTNNFCVYSSPGIFDNFLNYTPGDVVSYSNSYYLNISSTYGSTNPPGNTSYWIKVPTRLNSYDIPTVYNSTATYNTGDVVSDSTSQQYVYINNNSSTNIDPTDTSYWEKITTSPYLFSVTSSYYQGNIAKDISGNYYIALQSTTGNVLTDSNYWLPINNSNSYDSPNIYDSTQTYVPGNIVNEANKVYANILSSNVDPITDTAGTYWIQVKNLKYINLNSTSLSCNFDQSGGQYIPQNNKYPFYNVYFTISQKNLGVYQLTGKVSWNNLNNRSNSFSNNASISETIVSK